MVLFSYPFLCFLTKKCLISSAASRFFLPLGVCVCSLLRREQAIRRETFFLHRSAM